LLEFCSIYGYSFSMAQIVSVGPPQKPSSSIPAWSTSSGERSSRAVIQPVVFVDHPSMNARMDVEKVNVQPAASVAVPSRSKSPVSSSLHSSSLRSPHSDSKWTSFDESEEETSSIEHLSVSEQQGLLQLPEDGTSEGDDSVEESFIITPSLRDYYTVCFNQLLEKTQRCNTGALRGQDAGVFEFFLKSKLTRSELGRIWKLADVNEDGYLNLDEFCVAMHLVVRRVKGNFPIPESLPPLLALIPTPPRNATPVDEAIDKRWAKFGERAVGFDEPSIHRVTDGPDSPFLKDFTNALMLSNEQGSRLAYPVACRVSPDVGDHGTGKSLPNACSKKPHLYHYQQQQHSVNTSRTVVMSPQAPKGPPPKPPPRPVGNRHVRSASLDLTKSSRAPPTAPAPQLPRACLQRDSCAQTDLSVVMSSQHHSTVSVSSSSYASSSSSSATTTGTTTATTTTKLQQQSLPQRASASPSTRHVIGFRQQPLAPPPPITAASTAALSTTIPIAASSTIVSSAAAAATTTTATTTITTTTTTTTTTTAAVVTATPFHGVDANAHSGSSTEPTDWKFRCEQISQMNATLEHELKQLTEYRIGLELKLNRMKKALREK
ncbi:Actin cytoskeleton-regulatory complex protein PAN1, partial [Trichinella patagoniensis]